jgi:single-strand DNA-binding protein
MASVSKIILIGNVGREPELKMTPTGRAVCEFSIAVNRITGRSDSGERNEQTDWYRISCWAGLAERAQQMISKGRLVYVEGRFTPRVWTAADPSVARSAAPMVARRGSTPTRSRSRSM